MVVNAGCFNPHFLSNITIAKGIVAIRTFWQQPEPPFFKPVPSLYTLAELKFCFPTWKILHKAQFQKTGPDLKGRERKFYLTDLVVIK